MTPKELSKFLGSIQVNKETGCWEWLRGRTGAGYAALWYEGKSVRAHRLSYEHYVCTITSGMEIDHTCMVKCCVNPEHLKQVTHAENGALASERKENYRSAQTHCKNGHEFTEENTYYPKRNDRKADSRQCMICRREAVQKYRDKVAKNGT